MSSSANTGECLDCGTPTSQIVEVRKRNLCHACFLRYVSTKAIRRMESYRGRDQVGDFRPKLLLPLSGGVSSLALLHILDAQLKRQLEGRKSTAYDLVLVHITDDDARNETVERWRQVVSDTFPHHTFPPVLKLHDILQYDTSIEQDLAELGLVRGEAEDDSGLLARLFTSTKTATARSDLHGLLLQRLIVAATKKNRCEKILWGHSSTRLAAKTLADVSKGRGGSVPSATVNGLSLWDIEFSYPIRELYKSELDLYIEFQQESFAGCVMETGPHWGAPVATRNSSIDDLLTGYIISQGEKYPNLMANVVRTTSKLQAPPTDSITKCKICSMPVTNILEANSLCYGCDRMKQDIRT